MPSSPSSPSSAVSPSGNEAALFGAPVSELLHSLTEAIEKGIHLSMDRLYHAHMSKGGPWSPEALRVYLTNVLRALQPSLQHQMGALSACLSHTVFTLPASVGEGAPAQERVRERVLDAEIGRVCAQLRATEAERAALLQTLARTRRQNQVLAEARAAVEAAQRGGVAEMAGVERATCEAERECRAAVELIGRENGGPRAVCGGGGAKRKDRADAVRRVHVGDVRELAALQARLVQ